MKIYLIGSLKHDRVPLVAEQLREAGHEVFDDWHASGPRADEHWQNHHAYRGFGFVQALNAPFPQHALAFDKQNMDASDVGVLVFPAGKSGHIELGRFIGQGKPAYILFEREPEAWDLMYGLATGIFYTPEALLEVL